LRGEPTYLISVSPLIVTATLNSVLTLAEYAAP
jgi:hypothetical protein